MAMKDRVIRSAEVPNVGSCKVMCFVNKPGCIYFAIEVKFHIFTNLRGVIHIISPRFMLK